MNRKQQILQLADTSGIIRAKDAEIAGISRNYLYEMHREGLLEKISTELYTLPNAPVTENSTMAEVDLTTQLSPDIWLWLDSPPLNLTYVSSPAYSF